MSTPPDTHPAPAAAAAAAAATLTDLILYENVAQHVVETKFPILPLPATVRPTTIVCVREVTLAPAEAGPSPKDRQMRFVLDHQYTDAFEPFERRDTVVVVGLKRQQPDEECNEMASAECFLHPDLTTFEGRLVRAGDRPHGGGGSGSVTIANDRTQSLLHFPKYDAIVALGQQSRPPQVQFFDPLGPEPASTPTTTVSYLADGVTWRPSYSVHLVKDDSDPEVPRIGMLLASVNIQSTHDETLHPRRISFVVGTVHSGASASDTSRMMKGARPSSYSAQVECCSVDAAPGGAGDAATMAEYERFDMQAPDLLVPHGLSIRRLFKCMAIDEQQRAYFCVLQSGTPPVTWGYRIQAPRFLPAGAATVYDPAGRLVGESHVKRTPMRGLVDLGVGRPNGLHFEGAMTSSHSGGSSSYGGGSIQTNTVKGCFVVTAPALTRKCAVTIYARFETGGSTCDAKPTPTAIRDGVLEWAFVIGVGQVKSPEVKIEVKRSF